MSTLYDGGIQVTAKGARKFCKSHLSTQLQHHAYLALRVVGLISIPASTAQVYRASSTGLDEKWHTSEIRLPGGRFDLLPPCAASARVWIETDEWGASLCAEAPNGATCSIRAFPPSFKF